MSCPSVIIQELYSNMHSFDYSIPCFITHVRGTRIVVTLELISKVLHVLRESHLDYPKCPCLKTNFCLSSIRRLLHGVIVKTCSGFAKVPRFLNMVMTFVLHPLSHYNSITEPHARFLLSLIEDLTIDFPSHFILSLIDVNKDTVTRDKLIFPSAITRIIHHSSISYLKYAHFTVMCAISVVTV